MCSFWVAASIPSLMLIGCPFSFRAFVRAVIVWRTEASEIVPMHPILKISSLSFPAPPAMTTLYLFFIIFLTSLLFTSFGFFIAMTVWDLFSFSGRIFSPMVSKAL